MSGVVAGSGEASTRAQGGHGVAPRRRKPRGVMGQLRRTGENVRVALRSLRSNVMRSALTALGVIIGVGAVITLTSLGEGVTVSIESSFANLGVNVLSISNRNPTSGGGLVATSIGPRLSLADAEAIRDLRDPRVLGVAATSSGSAQARTATGTRGVAVTGTWPSYAQVQGLTVEHGRFFDEREEREAHRVVVIGALLARELLPPGASAALGARITVDQTTFEVIGVLEEVEDMFGSSGREFIVPLGTFLERMGRNLTDQGRTAVGGISVAAVRPVDMRAIRQDLTQFLAVRHGTMDPDGYRFSILNPQDLLDELNTVTGLFVTFLAMVAGISLLVGGIGIMNIMLVSVTERTREIGVRKALGAEPRDILEQFLFEAASLSGAGGAVGVALGLLLATGLGSIAGLTPVADPLTIAGAVAFALAIGAVFGLYPAQRAARLDPVSSLRYE